MVASSPRSLTCPTKNPHPSGHTSYDLMELKNLKNLPWVSWLGFKILSRDTGSHQKVNIKISHILGCCGKKHLANGRKKSVCGPNNQASIFKCGTDWQASKRTWRTNSQCLDALMPWSRKFSANWQLSSYGHQDHKDLVTHLGSHRMRSLRHLFDLWSHIQSDRMIQWDSKRLKGLERLKAL